MYANDVDQISDVEIRAQNLILAFSVENCELDGITIVLHRCLLTYTPFATNTLFNVDPPILGGRYLCNLRTHLQHKWPGWKC